MGFNSYEEYLESELWASIRLRVLEKADRFCQCCGHQATQVHHLKYSVPVMRGEDLTWLVPIYGPCHHKGEFFENGNKRSHRVANKTILKMMKARGSRWMDSVKESPPTTKPHRVQGDAPLRDPAESKYCWRSSREADRRRQERQRRIIPKNVI